MLEFAAAILSQEAVVTALAGLLALTMLVRRQLECTGIPVLTEQLAWLQTKVEEAVLHARQTHRDEADDQNRNRRMHQTAVKHVLAPPGSRPSVLCHG